MNENEIQLKVQALVDGELTGREEEELQKRIDNDAALQTLHARLTQMRAAVTHFLFSARSLTLIIPLRHPGAIGACMIRWTASHPPQSTAHPMTRHRFEKCCGMNFAKTIGSTGCLPTP